MYYFYFDSGTTNTRAYLIKDSRIVQKAERPIGSRNCSLNHSNQILKDTLWELYQQLLRQEKICDKDIADIYLSGMVSCPSGLIEVEHLSTPVDLDTLRTHITPYFTESFGQRKLLIIPGVKTLPQGQKARLRNVEQVNNMRGEETEIFGILHRCPQLASGHSCIILPGSHTQAAFIENGVIADISSYVAGELYHSIVGHTILGSSVCGTEMTELLPDMICMGYESLNLYGFNRALYMVRTMELFSDAALAQRRSYLEGVINGSIINNLFQKLSHSRQLPCTIAIAGPHLQYQIYHAIAAVHFPQYPIMEIPLRDNLPFTVEGVLNLIHH